MPVYRCWNIYPYLSVQTELADYTREVLQSPGDNALLHGIDFGFCARWLHRILTNEDESQTVRIDNILRNLSLSASTGSALIGVAASSEGGFLKPSQLAETYSVACVGFELQFQYAFSCGDTMCSSEVIPD